jgi:DedD protein
LKSAGFYRNSLDKSNLFGRELRRMDSMLICGKIIIRNAAMSPPILDERSKQDSHRAKMRIGVAAALLVTAIVILTALNQRREENTADAPAEAPPAAQTNLSSTDMEASPDVPEESPSTTATASPIPEPVAPPPPPEPGKLPDTSPVPAPKAVAAPALEEESAGAPQQQPFVARAAQSLSKPQMSAAAVQSPARSPSTASAPATPLAPKGYAVQLGVFTDIDNAKQLQSKLAEHGIPSHTETRVQIGPFKSREEADRAREKLKKLGIAAVIRGQ